MIKYKNIFEKMFHLPSLLRAMATAHYLAHPVTVHCTVPSSLHLHSVGFQNSKIYSSNSSVVSFLFVLCTRYSLHEFSAIYVRYVVSLLLVAHSLAIAVTLPVCFISLFIV